MNITPQSDRLHIGIFGRRNAGKSSLINALTNQDIALVSEVAGTTTDPVYKSMEMLPLGPVVIIDTAGIDDAGVLGDLRVKRSLRVLSKTDLALLVIDALEGIGPYERDLVARIRQRGLPLVLAVNKVDLRPADGVYSGWERELGQHLHPVSAARRSGVEELKGAIIAAAPADWGGPSLVGGLVERGDTVVLCIPIDSAMPKGRLILPQVQTIRAILDQDATAICVKEYELKAAIEGLKVRPKLVITDSQVFDKADADTPRDVPLTSFSMLYARHKGDLEQLVEGARAVETLRPGDKVLIAEACTHHRQSDDIGTVLIPRWLRRAVGGDLRFEWYSGSGFPEHLAEFNLVVHCGGCMINRREMLYRLEQCEEAGVPVVNYGVLLAKVQGVLERALEPFPAARMALKN